VTTNYHEIITAKHYIRCFDNYVITRNVIRSNGSITTYYIPGQLGDGYSPISGIPDIGEYRISVYSRYILYVPDMGYTPDIGYSPISGVLKITPDIGCNIRKFCYRVPESAGPKTRYRVLARVQMQRVAKDSLFREDSLEK
jgi:hypothetical protein